MEKIELIERVKQQNFPAGSYVVFGSGPMVAAGIRAADDIDLVVSEDLYEMLKQQGWHEGVKPTGESVLEYDVFEAFTEWTFDGYHRSLAELLPAADIVDGVPFVNLKEVRQWKALLGREKDMQDVQLIDEHMKRNRRPGITLIGMPTCGKSTIGRILSKKLGMPMLDVDRWMEQQEDMLLPEIIRTKGAEYVLALESSCVRDYDLRETIVSTPGSIIYNDVLEPLQRQTRIVWLDVPLDEIRKRLGNDTERQGEIIGIKEKGLDGLFNERVPLYRQWAQYVIDCKNKTADDIANEVIATLGY